MASKEISYLEALRSALREEMLRDPDIFVIGEDVRVAGVWGVTKGLADEFGTERVRDTPISESAFSGAGIGAAIVGMRPVVEIRFADFLFVAMDQVANQAAKLRFMTGGQAKIPVIFRSALGTGGSGGPHHSQCPEALFMHIPGLRVVLPSTPYDAKGLLKTALRQNNPVMFFEHKLLYPTKGSVPESDFTIPFGVADVKRQGRDLTVVATSLMVHRAIAAANQLMEEGIEVEVIDPRTLAPLDKQAILASVKKTSRLVVVEEDCKTGGFGAEITAIVAEEAFDYLDAPVKRIATLDVPMPFAQELERKVIPDVNSIVQTIREVVGSRR